MTSRDEGQDRELLQRYAQASRADPLAPSAAVRDAILEEGHRVAASFSTSPLDTELKRRRTSRWKVTAWSTAAVALLAALVIAPRLAEKAPPPSQVAAISKPAVPFNQAARKTESVEPSAEPRPVVPVMPVTAPKAMSIDPSLLASAPTLRRTIPPPPPVHIPEQSVEITPLNHAQSAAAPNSALQARVSGLAQARSMAPNHTAGSDAAQPSANASAPLLAAAAAEGDLVKTTQLLDQGAAINDRDASGRTPLMLAVGQNQIDAVRLLLKRGADPNAVDQDGLSPLALARQSNRDDIAALLIKAGAR